uniref:Cytochrome p450 CYP3045B3 n=1 Tax=Brachionus calyciflorus TaxID=104777 RepID=A0A2H4PSH1_9BILA|nr:cytochrome p450 CYP3045B3 [Brachionus calyciflorus]
MDKIQLFLEEIKQIISKLESKNVLKITGLGFFGFTLIYCGKIWYAQKLFKRLGLKTPKYRFFYGNLPEVLEQTQSNTLRKWTKEFGKTYGYYEGHLPIIVTSDIDFINEVFIKQYSNFMARKIYPWQFSDNSPKMDLFLSSNKRWKRMRNIINPTFSPSKLKELIPIMNKCTQRFLDILDKNLDEELIISDFLNRYTMDTIWNSATGMDIDCQSNIDNEYMHKALDVFKDLEHLKFGFRVTTYFDEFRPFILHLMTIITFLMGKINSSNEFVDPLFWLTQNIHEIIEKRKKENILRRDFTQLLIESKIDDNETLKTNEKIELSKFRLDREMSFEEIEFNLVGFLLAGFETTSSALNYSFFILANHPSELKKLQEELDEFYLNNGNSLDLNFDNISQLEYLDMFIKEVLRMYPISSNTVNRRCMFATEINGLKIPAGVSVTVDVLSIHYDAEIWGPVDPEEFYPLRFSPDIKRSSSVYLPFGIGPRNCVGMRYALMEMKMALAKILFKYDVLSTEKTPKKFTKFTEGTVRRPKDIVTIKLTKRS